MRCDLQPLDQAIQACHACLEAARFLLSPSAEHPHLVLCGVASQRQLREVLARLDSLGIPCRSFCDADFGGEMTALATAPLRGEQRRLMRRYQCLRWDEVREQEAGARSEVQLE